MPLLIYILRWCMMTITLSLVGASGIALYYTRPDTAWELLVTGGVTALLSWGLHKLYRRMTNVWLPLIGVIIEEDEDPRMCGQQLFEFLQTNGMQMRIAVYDKSRLPRADISGYRGETPYYFVSSERLENGKDIEILDRITYSTTQADEFWKELKRTSREKE
ncbi:hypothetical protein Q5741_12945 [Paenibacillus sp. JX-17]|uniref:Uncharacterized protein n=1 Tax=Paenibacillus lacisoli TaxID=3064525 RepID=A0ABT9CF95_9BACL|nr:hypothetical protein [Paenibacillus sp. JX-17]MDO7907314.1 hypothetical protein [Paenibacillus sp. JX-17]